MDEEGLQSTANERISIGSPIQIDKPLFLKQLKELTGAAYCESDDIRKYIAAMVPTYKHAGKHGSEEKGRAYDDLRRTMQIDKIQ